MKTLRAAPLFKVTLALAAGILLAEGLENLWPLWGLAFFPVYFFLVWRDKRLISYRYEYLTAVCLYLSVGGTGALLWQVSRTEAPVTPETFNCREVLLAGVVSGPVKVSAYGWKAELSVWAADSGAGPEVLKGKVLLTARNQDSVPLPARFDSLYCRAYLTTFSSVYPGYERYLNRRGIRHSAYLKALEIGGPERGLPFRIQQSQAWLAHRLAVLVPDRRASAVAQAMLLGEKSELEEEVRTAFAAAGLSHVLAISGLHVGIVFWLLEQAFSFLHLFRHGQRIRNLLILVLLLAYMLLTGAGPAVIRAVLMFGTILLFRSWYRRYRILNLVALSALLQLLWDPGLLFSVGFQLSYSAVIGLVTLYPIVQRSLRTGISWLDAVYGWIGVTLVATLFTAPLVWAYFGQFPTWFVLSNVLASLLVTAAVGVGFLTVMFCWLPGVNELLGWLTGLLLGWLEALGLWVAGLPFAVITEWGWEEAGVWCLVGELGVVGLLYFLGFLFFHYKGGNGKN